MDARINNGTNRFFYGQHHGSTHRPVRGWSEIFEVSLVPVRCGPGISKAFWFWYGAVMGFQKFLVLVRCGHGISKVFGPGGPPGSGAWIPGQYYYDSVGDNF